MLIFIISNINELFEVGPSLALDEPTSLWINTDY